MLASFLFVHFYFFFKQIFANPHSKNMKPCRFCNVASFLFLWRRVKGYGSAAFVISGVLSCKLSIHTVDKIEQEQERKNKVNLNKIHFFCSFRVFFSSERKVGRQTKTPFMLVFSFFNNEKWTKRFLLIDGLLFRIKACVRLRRLPKCNTLALLRESYLESL